MKYRKFRSEIIIIIINNNNNNNTNNNNNNNNNDNQETYFITLFSKLKIKYKFSITIVKNDFFVVW